VTADRAAPDIGHMNLRQVAARLRRLPLFDLWPGARRIRRGSDRLEGYAWVAGALVCALAVPVAVVAGLRAHTSLSETAREQAGAVAPMGGAEVALYATGAGLAVYAAAVTAA
jgi:hypothetical protein